MRLCLSHNFTQWPSVELLRANAIVPLPQALPKGKKRQTRAHAPEPTPEAGPSNPKRRRTSGVEEPPEAQVKPEPASASDDDDEDDVTFLEVRTVLTMLASGTCTMICCLGTIAYAPATARREESEEEMQGSREARSVAYLCPRRIFRRSDRPHLTTMLWLVHYWDRNIASLLGVNTKLPCRIRCYFI